MPDNTQLALCVDLDGTLIRTDLSVESLFGVIKLAPWLVFLLPVWLLKGRHYLKAQLAKRTDVDVSVLPYNLEVLDLIEDARRKGRGVYLVTGSNELYAKAVGSHLGVFEEVFASNEAHDLTASAKADLLVDRFGEGCFEYIANGKVDLPIWRSAGKVVTVNASPAVQRQAASYGKPHVHISSPSVNLNTWLKTVRIHHWTKNALLFVPLLAAHRLLDVSAILDLIGAFLAFSLCASATYIINDLFDLDSDRHHSTKRHRAFAAGDLSAGSGIIVCTIMMLSGLSISFLLPIGFQLALVAYLIITLLYSLRLKNVASLDVLILAGLYTLRVIAGGFAADVTLSFWLLAFSMFIFLCLALVKRVAELTELQKKGESEGHQLGKTRGREYDTGDIPILQSLGAASGYLAVLILALYINSDEVLILYRMPQILWLLAPLLLLWITRLWVVTTRGYMDDDPIVFAVKDPETWMTAAITSAIIVSAT